MPCTSIVRRYAVEVSTFVFFFGFLAFSERVFGQGPADPPTTSPDGVWRVLDAVEFPPDYRPPTRFVALELNELLLRTLLEEAPRETFGPIPGGTELWLPLPQGGFAQAAFAESQLMEPPLPAMFPEISTFVFAGEGLAGQLALGPGGPFFTGQLPAGLWRLEPIETRAGRVYLSYLDAERNDGVSEIVHDPNMDGDHEPPAEPPALVFEAGGMFLPQALEAGSQLRIYRLAASTTGEFYQARAGGGGLLNVVFSLLVDLAGANAIFEPEVSVRLILAAASLDVIYDDPDTDPFVQDDDPNTDDGDPDTNGDVEGKACDLRDDNRDNMMAVLDDDDYDLGFLFAARSGGGANGCAWFVVCLTTDNTLHKARGAGKMGNNGLNSASGLLAHEVGHQLGARHTFTGEDGSCTLNEFQAGNSESGYEPGSGTTRMSYSGNCDSDNVDVDTSGGALPAGSYFHSRSFDEIVDNAFNGDGSTCGSLVATGNLPPTVDAGPDYTIPRQTPFMLSGSAADDEPLTYNWEQFDRALVQREINTDPGDGPIIRSIPPDIDPTRTVPNLQDLLDGVTRAGEILPQVDRDELTFRFIARDNLMGGGGVAYDTMVIDVEGDPFFITSPNSGAFDAACTEPLIWEVGGGSVATHVQALFSSDGGQTFDTALTGAIDNDGADTFAIPCDTTGAGRIKLASVGNIFFDINDGNLTVINSAPTVEVSAEGGPVDDNCEFTVTFEATATDACGLAAADVEVEFIQADTNFTLGTPVVNKNQVNANQVDVSGSVLVSDLTSSPAQLAVSVTATDACGEDTNDYAEAVIVDDTPPEIEVSLEPSILWPPTHKLANIQATVIAADNCPGVSFVLDSIVSDEPEEGLGDGDMAPDIVGAEIDTADLQFRLRKERGGLGDGRTYTVTYVAADGSENETADSATVEVPFSQ